MKLYFESFKQTYSEFQALQELTKKILESMGIIFRRLSHADRRGGHGMGVHTNRFSEFDDEDEDEQEMQEEGVYSSTNRADILTMQNMDESHGPVDVVGELPFSPDIRDSPLSKKRNDAPYESQVVQD